MHNRTQPRRQSPAPRPLTTPWDQRLTPDAALGARDPKVAALLARTEAAGR